ncbi:MAG: hypothetical protein K2X87_32885 [Gemmataceae bacterium]|nr:hypothetical protein [Gemmataceae bacterium]
MRLAPRVPAGLGLLAGAVLLAVGSAAVAQEPAKGPAATPAELFAQVQARIAEGKYDLAALFLQVLVDSNPPDQFFLSVVTDDRPGVQFGGTAFRNLRNVPRWSDDPQLDRQARANVETLIKRATDATEKLLRNPARVTRFVRNLGETPEEREFAVVELRRTGDYAVPFMVEALRDKTSPAVTAGVLGAIPRLDVASAAAWVAALDGLDAENRYGVASALASRPDALTLTQTAQTDLTPALWRMSGNPDNSPAIREFARRTLEALVRGADRKDPAAELVALARPFADRKARYLAASTNPDGSPAAVPVWTWNEADRKLAKQDAVPPHQADEYFGLRYARWALELRPEYEPAQALILAIAADKAMERGRFGELARTDPAVYRLLADAPAVVLTDLLDRALAEKRTGLVLAMTQVLGDRAERAPATAAPGKPSLYERALDYPDPRVQLAAASALLRSPAGVDPKLRPRVVDVLRRAAAVDPAPPGTAKGQVLLADPDRRRADIVAAYLRAMGLGVDLYGTGRDLLRRATRSADYDLIVLDRHVGGPEVRDLVAQLRADRGTARVPVVVVASADRPVPPSSDQLLLRFAQLIAATDLDPVRIPPPYVPDLRKSGEVREGDRAAALAQRDDAFRTAAEARLGRLRKVLETTGLELTDDQRFQLRLRSEQVTYAVLAAEFPLSPESAPRTAQYVDELNRRIAGQPNVPEYTREVGINQLMKLVERLETDVAKNPAVQARYDALRDRVDPAALGLVVRAPRDFETEARLARLLRNVPAVYLIPEPYSRVWFEASLGQVFADPADRPRDPAEKRAAARLALGWLSRMATGEVVGFDARPAAPELLAALRLDDLADVAIPGVAKLPTADAQQALVTVAVTAGRPLPLRLQAADAAVRHAQQNGALTPKTLTDSLATEAGNEADPDLRGRLLVLKGLLAPPGKNYATDLRNYYPPLVPPPPAGKDAPPPKGKDPAEPGKEPDPKGDANPKQ